MLNLSADPRFASLPYALPMEEQRPQPEEGVPFVAGRWSRRLLVGGCTALGVLAAMISLGDLVDHPNPPSDDLIALLFVAEGGAAIASAPLLAPVLGRRSQQAGLALGLLAGLSAATPAAIVAVVLFVSLRSWRIGVQVLAAFVASSAAAVLVVHPGDAIGELAVLVAMVVVMVLVGIVLSGRRALAEQAQRERELVLERARSHERARIASEMHDTLSHHLSLIALHAGALGRREDLPPETVRSSSRLVADLSRTAHAELRDVLGVLHEGPQETAPPPGAADLPQLLEQHRAAGAEIHADLDPDVVGAETPTRLTEATSRLLHRVTRELLANAARHAPGVPVDVVVSASGDQVELSCRNRVATAELPAAGDGLGLEGIAERVRLSGGHHRAGVVEDEFVVWVSVPW